MNERIKELIEQATTQKQIVAGDEFQLAMSVEFFDKEKFAELIVRKCAEVADNADATRQKWEGIGKYVREHFGVEE